MAGNGDLRIFAGKAGLPLAQEVVKLMIGEEVGDAIVDRFNDGEVRVELGLSESGNVRGKNVFVINPTHMPHENIFDLLMLVDAIKRTPPRRITMVVPYLAYNRQDRKTRPRTPISAAVMMKLLASSGADGILLFDMHSEATQGLLDPLKVDHLYLSRLAIDYYKGKLQAPFVIGAPDHGATGKARYFAKHLDAPKDWVVFDKERVGPGEIGEVTLIGKSIEGCDLLLVDDMVDSGNTLIADAIAAKQLKARRVRAFVSHAILSNNAIQRLDACSALDELTITDSIRHSPAELKTKRLKVNVLPIARLVAEAIKAIHSETSVSKLIL